MAPSFPYSKVSHSSPYPNKYHLFLCLLFIPCLEMHQGPVDCPPASPLCCVSHSVHKAMSMCSISWKPCVLLLTPGSRSLHRLSLLPEIYFWHKRAQLLRWWFLWRTFPSGPSSEPTDSSWRWTFTLLFLYSPSYEPFFLHILHFISSFFLKEPFLGIERAPHPSLWRGHFLKGCAQALLHPEPKTWPRPRSACEHVLV